MQYSDYLDYKMKQHRNAKLLGAPVMQNPVVTLANLSPLDWQGGNHQASVNYSIDRLSGIAGMGNNPDYGSWHLRDYLVG